MLGSGLGGIERAAIDYAESLKMQGADVLMLTSPNAAVNQLMFAGAQLTTDFALTHLQQRGAWDIWAGRRLNQIIHKYQATHIITHGNRALQLSSKAKVVGVPIIAVSHNYNMQHLDLADGVFCITNHMLGQVRKTHTQFNSHNSFYIPNMLPYQLKWQARHMHNPIRIGAIGRLIEKKGFPVLLKAIKRLYDEIEGSAPFEVWLAGDGEERSKLEKIRADLGLENIVRFCGWVENTKDFYREMDIFCLPSLDEPFGIVLLEAMVSGVPIIATKTAGPLEIIKHNQTGLLVEIGDPQEIVAALLQLINNRNLAINLSESAHQYAIDNFTKDKIASLILDSLSNLARN
jgi:glycosyltransferase involved in cell wall biosynthesis